MKIKDRSSQHGETLQKLKDARQDELSRVTDEIQIEQAKKTLADIRGGLQQGQSLASMIFRDKSPEQIKELLSKLTADDLSKLQQLVQATDTNPVSVAMRSPPSSTRDDVLLKYILESKDKSLDTAIQLFKLMKEMQPQQAPVQIQAQPQSNKLTDTLELVKIIGELNRPFYESLGKKDKELYDAKLDAVKAGMPSSLEDQIKYVKEMAPVLGLGNTATNDLDLRLEEMRENRDLDNRRLDWEQKKYEMEMDADNQKWEQITKILQGPIGQAIQGIGNAGADRVRGRGGGKAPKVVQTTCPQCAQVIFVDQDSETAVCGHCGAVLQKQGTPMPQQPAETAPPTPATTHVDAQAEGAQAQPAVEETEEEEEENELRETETASTDTGKD